MTRAGLLFVLSLFTLVATACAGHSALAPDVRRELEAELTQGQLTWYLRESKYVTPFFGDASKRLLTAVPPQDVRLLEDPSGNPISPGPVQDVVPVGRRVRILRVEFPTAVNVAERLLVTPRTQPWIHLEVEGVSGSTPLILVLPADTSTEEGFNADLERHLTRQDPAEALAALPAATREAVLAKRAQSGMTAEALRMAWGLPERIRVDFRDGIRSETWRFPGDRRSAVVEEGRVVRLNDPG